MSLRPIVRRGALVALVALSFLAGGLVVPQLVSATVSSGEREAFFPLPPTRILDTRFGPSPLPVGTQVGPGQTIELVVGGAGGVRASAGAVVLNVTVVNATQQSLLTLHPTGTTRPTASSLNFVPGEIVPNAVTVKLGTSGKVSIYNDQGTVDVVVDVNGFYENVTFDDRYYTKAQSDAQVATAITTPNHVTSNQVAASSLNGSDIQDGSLSLGDLTGVGPFDGATLGALNIPAGGCQVTGVTLTSADAFRLLVPMRIAPGVAGSTNLGASPVAINGSGIATIQICNRGGAAFAIGSAELDYYLT